MRKSIALAVTAATTAGLAAFVPTAADAASCTVTTLNCGASTATTFTITGGTLSISVPDTADLGTYASSATGTTVQGLLTDASNTPTVVTDTRGGLLDSWQVAVTASDFTTGGGTVPETVLGSTVTAWSGNVTVTNTGGTKTQTTSTAPVAATGALPIASNTGYAGNDSASYTPTISVLVPGTNASGTYSGTITQTVS
ncbi:MAG TPA: hypothetical protein VFJ17_13920 [Mycobacteriales bacterium]|jgi:hypothetical protein|nr:hypothetical protein [Mycobacteriales bacterium]